MSELKTLKDVLFHSAGVINYPEGQYLPAEERMKIGVNLREAAREWRDKLKGALEKACKQEGGHLCNTLLGMNGQSYVAAAYNDDEAKPIIKFINQFFNLESED